MQAAGKVSAREAQRLATRERLFAAAIAEFRRSGVAAADVGAIVAAAGVAHGTFFFHFPTKEHVLAELGQREEIRMAADLDRFLARPRDLETTLVEVVRMAASLERRLGRPLFKDMLALYFSPTRPELRPWNDHPLIARVVAAFEGVRAARGVEHADPANSATFFFLGMYALLLTHERTAERASMLEQYVTLLLRGLDSG
jgi:AcrR family transcriptional regulator